MKAWEGVIAAYRERLPLPEETPAISLLEGNTPLVPSVALREALPGDLDIFFKCEGLNPTGSFKDRGMVVAFARALARKASVCLCASTGNTAASAAAYAARSGLRCIVLLPEGSIARGKLAQAAMHGAKIVSVAGPFDNAMRMAQELVLQRSEIELVNSVNPFRIEGQKTAAFEVSEALGDAPDFHFLPVGNAGNITAYWKGYREYAEVGKISRLPRMVGFQAAGAAPIVEGRIITDPQTMASAIRIGNPASWKGAIAAATESGGWIAAVTDEEILDAYQFLARREGIFVEPASAAAVAGLRKEADGGRIPPGSRIVVTLTGHGLKDPDVAARVAAPEPIVIAPALAELLRAIEA
ncbi:threonine synthase [Methylacidimicrobium cyclopophantes]|uniref:Threonine synthase n=1 Tax=Methylacidimicrobium cyclopophantes TaxID=1041766 RepID=A0A5E6M4E6_9BACT|nr:threonine synthase [Methylacidimicrobium cyclopophantes]VVM04440.1 threonine synthase [Methylacidimicrobium cyclopophantes]